MKTHYHYIYKITNNITNKYYIGMHTTYNIDDEYFGSGLILKRSIAKYGKENHTKVILFSVDTRLELIELEKEMITEELLNDQLSMNIRLGGEGGGGWTKEQQQENNRRSQIKQQWLRENDGEWNKTRSKKISDANLLAYKEGRKVSNVTPHIPGEFKHSEDTKSKISSMKKGKKCGDENPSYGTCWIYNTTLKQNKKIKKDELDTYLKKNWCQGRKMKF